MTVNAGTERARVSLRLGPDSSDRVSIPLLDDSITAFGRGADSPIRFGHAPLRDREVPRTAGWFIVNHGRVIVEAATFPISATSEEPSGNGERVRRPLRVECETSPPMLLTSDWAISPSDSTFTVAVAGETRIWELDVAVRRTQSSAMFGNVDDPTMSVVVELTDELRDVLNAYGEPVLRGMKSPATHDEVADALHYSKMSVRRRLEKICDEFYSRKLWMPDTDDARVRVVESALHHGLLKRASGNGG